eukprot:TRINITY_DN6772_c0_g1_i1.p1 TRINITY_DN6772_c0_g1~~TRINITY_DN6772_c0_g1_i1.p1  ORF type:complete len:425 (+),score=102.75 TRINITY_DN6772_c0_g1_i1:52-1326(+)
MECKIPISNNVKEVPESPTLAVGATIRKLKGEGKKVYDFGVGELNPYISVPKELRSLLSYYNGSPNYLHYTAAAGDAQFIKDLSQDFKQNWNQNYEPSQIAIFPGPKDAFGKACLALLLQPATTSSPRNRVVVFSPIYEAFYAMPVLATGLPPIQIPSLPSFLPDLEVFSKTLEQHHSTISIVVINSPNNPTGVFYPEETMKKLTSIISQYPEIAIFSDEVYRSIVFEDQKFTSPAHFLPNQTLVFGGISKEFAGTGLRIGWCAGPKVLIDPIIKLTGCISSCVNLPVQKAMSDYLCGEEKKGKEIETMEGRKEICRELKERRRVFFECWEKLEWLRQCEGWENNGSVGGAFYFFVGVKRYLNDEKVKAKGIKGDEELAKWLLDNFGVSTIPGSKFGWEGHLRMCFARDEEMLRDGLAQLNEGF